MSRRLFIASLFDGGLVDKHYRDVVANGINAFTLDAFQSAPIRLEFNIGLASRTREYFQEFLTNCHWLDLSAGMRRAYHKQGASLECGGLTPLCYRTRFIEAKAASGRRTPRRRPICPILS